MDLIHLQSDFFFWYFGKGKFWREKKLLCKEGQSPENQ
jgi:hypothetical protein